MVAIFIFFLLKFFSFVLDFSSLIFDVSISLDKLILVLYLSCIVKSLKACDNHRRNCK